MIETIDIHDLGVIRQASLPIGPGFTVLTGETGAGKTMVVTALGLLLGQRADTTRVRSGASAAWVEGRFHITNHPEVLDRVGELGGAVDEGVAIFSRHVPAQGSSKATVGGRAAPVSVLQELAEHLVVVHGQSDQVRLTSETAQRAALDRFAGEKLQTTLNNYRDLFALWREKSSALEQFDSESESAKAESERLRAALEHIERVRPLPGEDDHLRAVSDRLQNTEALRSAVASAKEALSSDDAGSDQADVTSLVVDATKALERAVDTDPTLQPTLDKLTELGFVVNDVVGELASYRQTLDGDDHMDLEAVMARRAELSELTRLYGDTIDEVLVFETDSAHKLLQLDRSDTARTQLATEVSELFDQVTDLATTLTEARRLAATHISEQVTAELSALAMPDATFTVSVTPTGEVTQFGSDRVSFLLAPHSGSEPRPLAKGASGGELSRVMLALEVVIAQADSVPTYIFDEVDAGVGGASALEIGKRLQALSAHAQVIVVTHLAQVACFADNHITVEKDRTGEYTHSSVRVLGGDDRVRELARMLGGDSDSDSALEHAKEMLERASVSRSANT